jgi:hypothetical protein
MCYITPKSISEDDFVENFLKGDYDQFLDDELAKNGWQEPEEKQPTRAPEAGTHAQTPEQRTVVAPPPPAAPEIAPKASTDGYAPGQWQPVTGNEDLIEETFQNIRKINPDLGEEQARELANKFIEGTTDDHQVRFKNGPHEVIFAGSLSPEKQQEFLGHVDHMQSKFPANRKLAIRVAPSSEFGWNVGGETTISTGHMRINERVMTQDIWAGMPVSKGVPSALYVLAHEWGHAFPDKDDARNKHVHKDAVAAGGMTRYGTVGDNDHNTPAEGYAEAFAEWSLTNGQTTNPAAREYARRFKWEERFGNHSH